MHLVYLKNYTIVDQEDDEDFEKIVVTPNTGTYDLEIVKVDKAGNKITNSSATININGQDLKTKNGVLNIPNIQINKNNLNKEDLFEIVEIKAPEGYLRYTYNMNVTITKKEAEDKSKYEVNEVSMEVVSPYGEIYQSNNIKVINRDGKSVVVVTIENEKIETAPSGGQNPNNGNVPNGQNQTGTGIADAITNYRTIINNIPTNGGSTTTKIDGSSSTNTGDSSSSKTDENSNKAINVKSTSDSQKEDMAPSATGDEIPGIVLNVIFLVVVVNIVQMRICKKRKDKNIIK